MFAGAARRAVSATTKPSAVAPELLGRQNFGALSCALAQRCSTNPTANVTLQRSFSTSLRGLLRSRGKIQGRAQGSALARNQLQTSSCLLQNGGLEGGLEGGLDRCFGRFQQARNFGGRRDVEGTCNEQEISLDEFHSTANDMLEKCFNLVDEAADDANYDDGVLTIEVTGHPTFVINKHFATKQIWYVSPRSTEYFDPPFDALIPCLKKDLAAVGVDI